MNWMVGALYSICLFLFDSSGPVFFPLAERERHIDNTSYKHGQARERESQVDVSSGAPVSIGDMIFLSM